MCAESSRARMRAGLVLIGCALAGVPALAQSTDTPEVSTRWCRATTPGSSNGACYMTLTNHGDQPARLVDAGSPRAGKVMLHRSVEENGQVTMVHQENGVAIPAGGSANFTPGGYHVMLMQLKGPLKAGDTIPLTLRFRRGDTVTLDWSIKPLAYQPETK